ncbi:unnamed protein product, partial [Gongylonema pulchrum]|uniref:DUF3535 domain-containing protein n=1 Tax=Gongylonema pulchrum TaxID=637853 RepID=A0A183D368_9BILA
MNSVVLHRLLRAASECSLLKDDCFDSIAAELVPSMLKIIRKSSFAECRRLAALVIGCLGAVDPGRIGLSLALGPNGGAHRNDDEFVFVNAGKRFYVELLEQAAIAFSGILDAGVQVECSYSIQTVLRELLGKNGADRANIWGLLSEQCRNSLSMLRYSSFTLHQPAQQLPTKRFHCCEEHRWLRNEKSGRHDEASFTLSDEIITDPTFRPIIDCEEAKDFKSWMNLWYKVAAGNVRDAKLKAVFSASQGLVNTDIVFSSFILPQLILEIIIEHNRTCMAEVILYSKRISLRKVELEIISVLRRAIVDSGWPQSAAHLVFAVIDCLERFTHHRKSLKIRSDS